MKRPYKQPSLEERRKIKQWHGAKVSADVNAERPGRDRAAFSAGSGAIIIRTQRWPRSPGMSAVLLR